MQIANESIEDLRKSNKIDENKKLKIENSLLKEEVKKLNEKLEESNQTIENLKARINKNSFNSSKPSSTDNIYKKEKHINSNRESGGKNGGQYGHPGSTLSEADAERLIKEGKVEHKIVEVGDPCTQKYRSKYILDVRVKRVVIEYRYYEDERGAYNIPQEMLPVVQYGPNAKAIIIYLTSELMCPVRKTSLFMQSLTENIFKFSEGTVVNTQKAIDRLLQPIVEDIKNRLIKEKILHVDETGVRINGKLKWLHTYCSKDTVYYETNEKRGGDAIDDIGILKFFVNILVHDHWKSYYKKGTHMTHAECNAHILRYLKGVLEIAKVKEVEELITLLVKMNNDKMKAIKEKRDKFLQSEIQSYENEYDQLISGWGKDLNKRISKSNNPKVYDDEKNLHDRLVEYKENHLLFIHDFDVPFDNNAAERSLRMIKSKLKVSGGFRTEEGAKIFSDTRSFIMTSKYKEDNVLSNLVSLFTNREFKFD